MKNLKEITEYCSFPNFLSIIRNKRSEWGGLVYRERERDADFAHINGSIPYATSRERRKEILIN